MTTEQELLCPRPECTAVCENCGCRLHLARVIAGLCSFCQGYINDLGDPPQEMTYLSRDREHEDAVTLLAVNWEE